MSNKFSTNKLLMIFAALLVVVVYLLFFSGGEERSFRKELVSIDTAKVSEIHIYPKDKKPEIVLIKDSGGWKVTLDGGKTAPVPKQKITGLLGELISVKPDVLTARDESKWKEYQVDSSGIRIEVLENGQKTLDMIIGRIGFQQPRSVFTYVRLNNDTDVYQTEGYLGISINRSRNDFRNPDVISGNKTKWTKLTFRYPSDSSFVLTRAGNRWMLNNSPVDSSQTEQLLNRMERITSTDFEDNFKPDQLLNPQNKVMIETNDTTNIVLDAYADSSGLVLHSSQNPESYFKVTKDLASKIFLSPKRFLKNK